MVENGLTQLGVTPYLYPLVRGGVIFLAMYADSLKSRVSKGNVVISEGIEEIKVSASTGP
jgi:hypothetical protein